jgi:hypothetical protein
MSPYRAAGPARRRVYARVRDDGPWFLRVLVFACGMRMLIALLNDEAWGWELAIVLAVIVVAGLLELARRMQHDSRSDAEECSNIRGNILDRMRRRNGAPTPRSSSRW